MPKVLVALALFGSVLFAASASFADQASAQTSNIVFTAPTNLTIPAGRTGYIIYAAGFARDGSNTFTCGVPTAVDSTRITVAQNAANSCFFTVNASATAPTGNATFTTLLTSSGGDTHSATFTIAITAASDITFTAPASIPIGTGRSKIIDVSGYATDGDYAITCSFNANPANRHRLLASVTATGCSFRVWAGSTQGAATVTVRYHSSGGDEQTGVIPLIIGPSSVLIYQRVSNLRVRTGGTITIDAGSYAHDRGGYPVFCGDATAVDSKITVNSRNGCVYNITAGNTTGRTSFSVPYTSASGSARTDRIDITIVASHIVYTAPAGLSVGIYSTIRINAADYASDGSDTISCGTIRQSHALIANIRSHAPIDSINDAGCSVSITAGGTAGIATFTVPYTSSGGDTHNGVVSLTIGTASSITLASNPQFLIRRDRVITIDAARYATDGDYDITCTSHRFSGAAAAFTLKVSRNGCIIKFQSGPSYSSRDLNLAVGYSSSGGATASVNIAIGAKLTDNINGAINFTPPIALAVAPSRSITIDASSYATLADSDLALFCLDARRIDSKITVTRKGCSYTIRAGSSVGVVAFTVPYISSGGYTTGGMISIRISPPPPSVLVFSEPDEFQLATNRTLTINGRDYASDGGYRISCRTTTDVDSKISLQPEELRLHRHAYRRSRHCQLHLALHLRRRRLHKRSLHHRNRPGFHHLLHRAHRTQTGNQPHPRFECQRLRLRRQLLHHLRQRHQRGQQDNRCAPESQNLRFLRHAHRRHRHSRFHRALHLFRRTHPKRRHKHRNRRGFHNRLHRAQRSVYDRWRHYDHKRCQLRHRRRLRL